MGRPARIADSAILRAGQARLTFKQPWRGETTAVVIEPMAFLARLAVPVAPPTASICCCIVTGSSPRSSRRAVGP
jgi:hypothetical protein